MIDHRGRSSVKEKARQEYLLKRYTGCNAMCPQEPNKNFQQAQVLTMIDHGGRSSVKK